MGEDEVQAGLGGAWFAVQPRCPAHGRMRDGRAGRWVCCGSADGRCPYAVPAAELAWVPLAGVGAARWRSPFTVTARRPGG